MYLIVARTGFCPYFVQSVEPSTQHMRMTVRRALAVRFRTADEARRHCRTGEEPAWEGNFRA